LILDTFSASLGKHKEEFPEWSTQHQMKIHKNFGLSGIFGTQPEIEAAICKEGHPLPGKVC